MRGSFDRRYFVVAAGCFGAWFYELWSPDDFDLRKRMSGLDQIVAGMWFFLLAAAISLRKAGIWPRKFLIWLARLGKYLCAYLLAEAELGWCFGEHRICARGVTARPWLMLRRQTGRSSGCGDKGARGSGDDLLDHLAVHVGQAEIAAGVAVGELSRGRSPAGAGSWRAGRGRGPCSRRPGSRTRRWRRGRGRPCTPPPASHIVKP